MGRVERDLERVREGWRWVERGRGGEGGKESEVYSSRKKIEGSKVKKEE